MLKSAETRALLERARGGDKTAREELISGNLRLVLSVIQKFAGRGESMDDLFQVGCITVEFYAILSLLASMMMLLSI